MSANPAIALYAIFATVLVFHLFILAGYTGYVRVTKKVFVNPEDAKLNKGELSEAEHPDVSRAKRAHGNALENALPFLAVGALYAATAPGHTPALIYFGTFVAMRVLHSIVYLWGRQPFRTMSFAVGVLAVVGMGIHVIRHFS
jgi:glutathione S-transferase